MSDFSRDADEWKCSICGNTYFATTDLKYCDACARIIYRKEQGNFLTKVEDKRIWVIEDAKYSRIVFKGTKLECDEWADEKKDGRIYIIRKGADDAECRRYN